MHIFAWLFLLVSVTCKRTGGGGGETSSPWALSHILHVHCGLLLVAQSGRSTKMALCALLNCVKKEMVLLTAQAFEPALHKFHRLSCFCYKDKMQHSLTLIITLEFAYDTRCHLFLHCDGLLAHISPQLPTPEPFPPFKGKE